MPGAALECPQCGTRRAVASWPICSCGGQMETVYNWMPGDHGAVAAEDAFDALLPLPRSERVTLGEGRTPLIEAGSDLLLKCEHLNPTGSYKDRIAAIGISLGRAAGARGWIGTSSGNAGAAFAAYGAMAGLEGLVFAVSGIPREKLAQIEIFGTKVQIVTGLGTEPSAETAVFKAVQERARREGLVLGITARTYNPAAMDGAKAIAHELVQQIGDVPSAIYVPVGGGGLLASIWRGFQDLVRIGAIKACPRMVGVQPNGCAPIHMAFDQGLNDVPPIHHCETKLSGLQLTAPPDGRQALAALKESGGFSVAVSDAAALDAQIVLARRYGTFVEPAAAIAYAGYNASPVSGVCVLVMTGSGLKTSPPLGIEPVSLTLDQIAAR